MSSDYPTIVNQFMQLQPSVIAMAILKGNAIVYSTDNWDISNDVRTLSGGWDSMNIQFIMISGIKYTTLELSIDTLVATSLKGEGHIIGFKDNLFKLVAYVTPDGDVKSAVVEATRVIRYLNPPQSYVDPNVKFAPKYSLEAEEPIAAPTPVIEMDPVLKSEIQGYIDWIDDPDGLRAYLGFYLQQNDTQKISALAKTYAELKDLCTG